MKSLAQRLEGSLVLVSCEGGAEDALIRILLEDNRLCFCENDVIDITRARKHDDIERSYLGFDYDQPVSLLYLTDSTRSKFKLGTLYQQACTIFRICTRPEIEILTVLNENRLKDFQKSRKKPSIYCKENLGMRNVKQPEAVRAYWSAETLVGSLMEYRRIHRFEKGELCLADLLASRTS